MSENPTIEELTENPFPEDIKPPKKKQVILTASVTARDKEIASWLAEFWGISRSEILRLAVRHLYADVSAGHYQRPIEG